MTSVAYPGDSRRNEWDVSIRNIPQRVERQLSIRGVRNDIGQSPAGFVRDLTRCLQQQATRIADTLCRSTSIAATVLPGSLRFDTSKQTLKCIAVWNVIDRFTGAIQLATDDRVPCVSHGCGRSPQPINAVSDVGQLLKDGGQCRMPKCFRLPTSCVL